MKTLAKAINVEAIEDDESSRGSRQQQWNTKLISSEDEEVYPIDKDAQINIEERSNALAIAKVSGAIRIIETLFGKDDTGVEFIQSVKK